MTYRKLQFISTSSMTLVYHIKYDIDTNHITTRGGRLTPLMGVEISQSMCVVIGNCQTLLQMVSLTVEFDCCQ